METGKMKLKINASYVGACLPAVSTESTRYNLNGVCIEPSPDGVGVICISTDGHRMILARDPDATIEGADLANVNGTGPILSIPKDAAKYLKPKNREWVTLTIEHGNATLTLERQEDGETVVFETLYQWQPQWIDGTFPAWRRVLPNLSAEMQVCDTFNAKYLADFGKVFKAFGDRQHAQALAVMSSARGGPALVRFGMEWDVFGVLMPMRGEYEWKAPEWIDPPKAFSQAAE